MMKKFGNVLWGIVFIVIGVIGALNATGIANINIFFKGWWTLFIIVPSFIGLIKDDNKTANVIFLCIGVILLLCAQNILNWAMISKLILPGILVIIGLSIIFGSAINKKVNEKIKTLNKDGLPQYAATFAGQKTVLQNEKFIGANCDAVFGGVELDLRNAIIEGENIINASAIFGGIEIFVPNHVNVKVKSTPIFGGVSDKTVKIQGENVPTIYINAFCMFGGVDIK